MSAINSKFVRTLFLACAVLACCRLGSFNESCAQPASPPDANSSHFDPELKSIVQRASAARAYLFVDRSPALRRSIQNSELRQVNLVGNDPPSQLRQLILSEETYLPKTAVIRPCIFVPDFGFELGEGHGSAWWLVSQACKKAMLVSRNKFWSDADSYDLQPKAIEALRQLLAASK